jgi:alkylhydroperoxidase/carboxymuconolactone decarboxylase family protein YurZ
MLPEKQKQAYEAFYNSTAESGILDPKTTVMVQLAAAFALGCYPLMEYFFGVARESGLTDEEIGAVQAIAMGVSAGRIRVQFKQVREKMGFDR